ncbi:MAG: ABC transporter substrate-binding protein [Atopostipes suicloacalis]|nr:ABC transporter substrate-binding protein [Atopostipes suicloacalis]MDN6731636.1 ABC transporter substrate-binding protein [Atopostipes suicloacalis]
MLKIKKRLFSLLSLFIALFLMACSGEEEKQAENNQELEETTVILDWTPNTNHSGLYTALEKGYYEKEGLDVNIIQPSEGSSNVLIATNQGDFGVSYQEDLTYAVSTDDPLPITAIAAIIQENTSGFGSVKDKNIESPKDFEGRTYGGWGSPSEKAILKTVMEAEGADFDRVSIVDVGESDFLASTSPIDIVWMFEGWTGIEAEIQGIELNYTPVKDLNENLDYYTPILTTNNNIIKENPDKVSKFLKATSKGYEFAIENPKETADILLKHAPELDEELVYKSQEFLSKEYSKGTDQWGLMEASVWENYTDFLLKNDLLDNEINLEDVWTNEFLQ